MSVLLISVRIMRIMNPANILLRRDFLGLYIQSRQRRYRVYHTRTRGAYGHDVLCEEHVSLPWIFLLTGSQTDPCGLQLFHLLEHTGGTGGATLLVDGFYVASILKELHTEAYELLSTVPVPTHAAGEADALFTPNTRNTPILKHEAGKLVQVRWNNDDRSVMRGLQPDQVEPWCVHVICRRGAGRWKSDLSTGTMRSGHGTSYSPVPTRSTGCSCRPALPSVRPVSLSHMLMC